MRTSGGLPRRPLIRLKGFDYASPALYLITLCTYERKCLLGTVCGTEVRLSRLGQIVDEEWRRTPTIRPYVALDSHIIMPNHVHAIIGIGEAPGGNVIPGGLARPGHSVGSIIAGYKSAVTSRARRELHDSAVIIWQVGYFDRIIRGEDALQKARSYIALNPERWPQDRYFMS
jgi:putative transposase